MPRHRSPRTPTKRPRQTAAKRRLAVRPRSRPSADAILADLKRRLAEIYDLDAAGAVLGWDEATYRPAARSRVAGNRRCCAGSRTSASSILRSDDCLIAWSRRRTHSMPRTRA
jgi:hypothetical protein